MIIGRLNAQPPGPLERHVVAAGCTVPATSLNLDDADDDDDDVVLVNRAIGLELVVKPSISCLRRECRQQSEIISELEKQRAELLLRSRTVDIERNACWLYLYQMGIPDTDWWKCYKVGSLGKIFGYPAGQHENRVRRKLAQWWSQQLNANLTTPEINKCLDSFYEQREAGNAAAHPPFHKFKNEHLLKLSYLARDDDRKDAWKIFFSCEVMKNDIEQLVPLKDWGKFEDADIEEPTNSDNSGYVDDAGLEHRRKPDKVFELLDRVTLPQADPQEYEEKLAAIMAQFQ